jgi:hypothetical protein
MIPVQSRMMLASPSSAQILDFHRAARVRRAFSASPAALFLPG